MSGLILSFDSDGTSFKETENVVNWCLKHGVSATFFQRVSVERKDDVNPKIFSIIKENGFELQPHPYLFDEDSREAFFSEVKRFEELTGCKASGFRNHGLVWRVEMIEWALELGLKYSSNSYSPAFSFTNKDSNCFKYSNGLVEVPIIVIDSEVTNANRVLNLFDLSIDCGKPFCVVFHVGRVFNKFKGGSRGLLEWLVTRARIKGVRVYSIGEFIEEQGY